MSLTSTPAFRAVFSLRRSQGPLQLYKTGGNCTNMLLLACFSGDGLKTNTCFIAQRRWIGCLGLSALQREPQTYRVGLCKQSPLGSCRQYSWPDGCWASSPVRLKNHSLLRISAYKENFTEEASTSSCGSDHSSYESTMDKVWQRGPLNDLSVLPGEVHLWWLFPDDVSTYPVWAFRNTAVDQYPI